MKWTIKDTKNTKGVIALDRFVIECNTTVPGFKGFKGQVATAGYLHNAKLIVSAPELLEACKSFMEEWDNPESNGNPDLFVSNLHDKGITHKIRQVVAKLEEK